MAKSIPVSKTGELADGTMKEILTQGLEILLARVGDKYYATGNRCPHLGGKLSQGKLEGTIVTCPRHGSQFDLRDGKTVRWLKGSGLISTLGKAIKPAKPLITYQVRVEGDDIRLEI